MAEEFKPAPSWFSVSRLQPPSKRKQKLCKVLLLYTAVAMAMLTTIHLFSKKLMYTKEDFIYEMTHLFSYVKCKCSLKKSTKILLST